jgi:hypothetical protein
MAGRLTTYPDMKLIITSRDRHDYAPTFESLPDILKSCVEVWVPKDQYKLYRGSARYTGATIECWPDYVDCIPKKRRYLYENVADPYLVLDDDLGLSTWSAKQLKYVPAKLMPTRFTRGVESIFGDLDSAIVAGATNTFMASKRILETGELEHGAVPFCFAGFAEKAKRPDLEYNAFFFTDIAMPLQCIIAGGRVVTNARIAYSMRDNQKLRQSGTNKYRTPELIVYSAMAMAKQFPGYIHALDYTGNHGGGFTLRKTFTRPNVKRTEKFLEEFMNLHAMSRMPKYVELDLKTPFAELNCKYIKSLHSTGYTP